MLHEEEETAWVSVDLLAAYVDGRATAAECARIRAHLERCERCRLLILRIEATRRHLPPG